MGSLVRAQEREQNAESIIFSDLKLQRPQIIAAFLFQDALRLHSLRTGKYYAGESPDVEVRLAFHNDPVKNTNSTKSGIPWELFWTLKVSDRSLARKIELHIKNMKSVKYYQNLKEYPEISEKLIQKYSIRSL